MWRHDQRGTVTCGRRCDASVETGQHSSWWRHDGFEASSWAATNKTSTWSTCFRAEWCSMFLQTFCRLMWRHDQPGTVTCGRRCESLTMRLDSTAIDDITNSRRHWGKYLSCNKQTVAVCLLLCDVLWISFQMLCRRHDVNNNKKPSHALWRHRGVGGCPEE